MLGWTCRVGVVKHKMDHLSCFIPAMLALGAHAEAVPPPKAARYLQARPNALLRLHGWLDD